MNLFQTVDEIILKLHKGAYIVIIFRNCTMVYAL